MKGAMNMFDETQTSESMNDTDVDLFADDDADDMFDDYTNDSDEVGADNAVGQDSAQQAGEANQVGTVLDIVYNGQSMQLTREEAVTLAQKGMNYDKKIQELEMLKNSPERQMFQQLADQSGMPYEQFLDSFKNQIRQSTIQVKAENLARQNGMDMNSAMMLAQSELEREELQHKQDAEDAQRQQIMKQVEQQAQRKEQFAREIADLVRENPDFQSKYPTVESMPQVMQDAILNGGSIKQAYQQVVIEQLKSENAAYKQNQFNMNQSPGSASGRKANSSDAFLNSLFGDD
jgi:arsenate reductase-like glutaredoxin family protein